MKPGEFLDLLFTACINIIYNSSLRLYEMWRFGRHFWWWKFTAHLWLAYLLDPPYRIIARFQYKNNALDDNLIYGETPLLTVKKFLEFLKPGPHDLFIDLGCGRGLPVFYAFMLSGVTSRGIDIVPEFIERASSLSSRLSLKGVSFYRCSFNDADLSDGTLFYMAGTTFNDALIKALTKKLEALSHPVRLITLSAPLPSKRFTVVKSVELNFSWGKTWAFFQESVDAEKQ